MRAYLECGMLAYGFVRARCEVCGASRAVAFSCKKRGFCPSCCGRRMADTAARLVDDVLPRVPVHQWVLSFPYEMRHRLAWDGEWVSAVLAVFLRVVGRWYGRQAQALGHDRARWGSVTFVQRFGSSLNLNPGRRGAYGALVLCFARFFAACRNADRRPLTGGGSNACPLRRCRPPFLGKFSRHLRRGLALHQQDGGRIGSASEAHADNFTGSELSRCARSN